MNAIRLYIQDLKTLKKNKDNLGVVLVLLFGMTFITCVLIFITIIALGITQKVN